MKKIIPIMLLAAQAISSAQSKDDLPPGVPRTVSPDGRVLFIEPLFTTRQFHDEVLRLLIDEANKVAGELSLRPQ